MANEEVSLTPRQFHFLLCLTECDERSNGAIQDIVEKATASELSRQAFYHLAKRLEEHGWVSKRKREGSTIRIYSITTQGRSALALFGCQPLRFVSPTATNIASQQQSS